MQSMHTYMLPSIWIALCTCATQCITTLKRACMTFIQTKCEHPTITLFVRASSSTPPPPPPPKGCDKFTENFLRKLGVRVPSSSEVPEDPHTTHRTKVRRAGHSLVQYTQLKPFCWPGPAVDAGGNAATPTVPDPGHPEAIPRPRQAGAQVLLRVGRF